MLKRISLHIISLFMLAGATLHAHAQTLNGKIIDAETQQPLEAVMISVIRGSTMIDYTLTDKQGHYSLSWKHTGTLQITASLLGYRKELREVHAAQTLNWALTSEAIVLKEVQIRPGRIVARKDTIKYDLAQFASSKDVHIKDVLKKLPGVDVDEDGQVKYNGKAIDHYFVEGMDVTGGRYNQINNNLSAKAVKSAEIMEDYQSVKALKGKIHSDEVALNLKLDPKARDLWMLNFTAGGGWNKEEALWAGTLNAIQLGKGSQSIYAYKTNNNGTDLSKEQTLFTSDTWQSIPLSTFIDQPAISAPLDKKRLLFNETHTLNGNRMYKWTDERSLRLQAGYTHHRVNQQRENTQLYFQSNDTLQLNESYNYLLQSDVANVELNYEDNSSTHYLTNRFTAEGIINKGVSDIGSGSISSPETEEILQQSIRTSQLTVANYFNCIRNREASTWEFRSATRYAYLPASLQLPDAKNELNMHNIYTDNSANYLRKRNGFTHQYSAGIRGELVNVNHYHANNFNLYARTYLQLERGRFQSSLTLPFTFQRFPAQQRSYGFFNPSALLRYQLNYHWKFTIYGSLNRSAGDATDFYPHLYRTDYRTWYNGNQILPISTRQIYSLYGEYKNTLNEFFVTASLTYNHTHQNTLNEQSISNAEITYTQQLQPNTSENYTFSTTLSKGFYGLHLKSSLTLLLSRSNGMQLSKLWGDKTEQPQSLLQSYRYDYLKAEPKLIWSPVEAFEAEYHATLSYGGSKIGSNTRLSPLLDFAQRLHITFGIGQINVRLSGEHYRNDLGGGTHLNTLFADASLIYKVKRWRLEAKINNLFNKKEYAYTLYSATQSYTSRLNIRPREAMATISYQF